MSALLSLQGLSNESEPEAGLFGSGISIWCDGNNSGISISCGPN
ncbi:hypothetical protein RL72_03619 [Microbacterium azadirachtae]|uniref:Lanthionine-containing peptide SapB n=1 Tax=Microbacterium azadirachtae TaxID=582680 RepID=A0A0F0KAF3_9MICO|nr:hypothetical protein RL72_03619 [Microbacterium azadirachtae]SDL18437.1 hypothetical protein SAMN04488593_0232 [Microbacterium azadirachtae]SEF48830.1 hypothetical protein SAMN04488594_0222 [Microbacterium azadirachtae]SEF48919.1 hypothetical protein SAMN04488592_0231 [Microbacterium azadirachtae]